MNSVPPEGGKDREHLPATLQGGSAKSSYARGTAQNIPGSSAEIERLWLRQKRLRMAIAMQREKFIDEARPLKERLQTVDRACNTVRAVMNSPITGVAVPVMSGLFGGWGGKLMLAAKAFKAARGFFRSLKG